MTGARILVVDDEADILSVLVYHLSRDGYRVTTAVNGAGALASSIHSLSLIVAPGFAR